MRLTYYLIILSGISWTLSSWQMAIAQTPSNASLDSPPNPVEQTLPGPQAPFPTIETPDQELPVVIPEDSETVEPSPEEPDVGSLQFNVNRIEVVGNTVLQTEITQLVNKFLGIDLSQSNQTETTFQGRPTTLEDLLDLRSQITDLYLKNRYLTSGAFLPNGQDLTIGVVNIQVIEGALEEIQINGLHHLKEYYVRDRINLDTGTLLNIDRLEEGLQLLQIDPLLKTVDAELTAGSSPGQNILILDLAEADHFSLNTSFDNSRAPSIGSLQLSPVVSHQNLLGFGDRFSARYNYSEGLDLYAFNYAVPVNALDGTLSVRFEEGESNIINSQFRDAGIRSETQTLSFNYRQPLTRSLSSEVALGFGFDLRESRSFILEDTPFSFSLGPDDGVSKVSVLRFSQEWLNRDTDTVLAARSQFNLGLDAFDATVNDTGTDGRFFSWIGQFQWVQELSPGTLLLARINAQLTPDSLLPQERFSLGGVSTVRGYAQNEIVTDNAITGSVEVQFPLSDRPNELLIAPFIDFGTGWNNRPPAPENSTLLGLGLGIQWQPIPEFDIRLDYGIPLISGNSDGSSLQENGIYFSVNARPF